MESAAYIVEWEEYTYPWVTIVRDGLSRSQADRLARKMSRDPSVLMAYVLDERRTGHIAYWDGRVDHRDGAHI